MARNGGLMDDGFSSPNVKVRLEYPWMVLGWVLLGVTEGPPIIVEAPNTRFGVCVVASG